MSINFCEAARAIFAYLSKIDGLYDKWARVQGVNPHVVGILYDLLQGERVTQRLIAEKFCVPKQTVNNAVAVLITSGHITLSCDSADKREKLLLLTDCGREYADKLLKPLFAMENRVYNRLGEDTINTFCRTLDDYCSYLEEEIR